MYYKNLKKRRNLLYNIIKFFEEKSLFLFKYPINQKYIHQ